MSNKKGLKFVFASFFLIGVIFLFFVLGSTPCQAQADLPIIFPYPRAGCSINPESTPNSCLDALPYGPYVELGWHPVDCSPDTCSYAVLRNGLEAISHLSCTSDPCTWQDSGADIGGLGDATPYSYQIKATNSAGAEVAITSSAKEVTTKVCSCPDDTFNDLDPA